MAVEIPIGFYQAVYRWSLEGDPEEQVTTMGFDIGFVGTLEEIAEELYGQATFSGSITEQAAIVPPWTFVGVTLYWRNPAGNLQVAVHNEPVSSAGGTPATPPNNCAVLVQKRTALAGVRHRGRMFLPPFGISETQINGNGMITTSEYNAIASRVSGWLLNMVGNDCNPVLLHSDGGTPSPITSLTLATQIATQRRRMRN
jgi:hypothetical protein